jgi:hypothetical protein
MPFYNIPRDANDFKEKWSYETDPNRRKVIGLCVKVNELYEQGAMDEDERLYPDGITTKGSYLYYNDLVFVHTVKRNRGHAYYFYPTDTMKNPLRGKKITYETLERIVHASNPERADGCLFWEFFSKPGEVWVSTLSQAYALELFGTDKMFGGTCEMILNGFDVPWEDGGVWDTELDWFLEYPMLIDDAHPELRRVLNGHLETLIILYRYYEWRGDTKAKELFDRGERALKEHLHKFIAPDGRTYYSMWQGTHPLQAKRDESYNARYHHLHVAELWRMWTITNDKFYYDIVYELMKVEPGYLPYYLTPYDVEIIEHRIPKDCCPTCKGGCKGCEVD